MVYSTYLYWYSGKIEHITNTTDWLTADEAFNKLAERDDLIGKNAAVKLRAGEKILRSHRFDNKRVPYREVKNVSFGRDTLDR